ncbi:MAG: hypothetical protein HS115_19525 [Spirochaetales bacterium]|nr:hypothetical protein [Spirochaetales bacterium]
MRHLKLRAYEALQIFRSSLEIQRALFLSKILESHPSISLNRFESRVYSQNGEDGILIEIFRRIGMKDQTFVEFGVGDGLENNTVRLLLSGWKGWWIEGSRTLFAKIEMQFEEHITAGSLKASSHFITRDNIKDIFMSQGIPNEIDLLSIDIDGNDYWIWRVLDFMRPRVIVIEYNASLGPSDSLAINYDEKHTWDGSNYFSASLKAYERLGKERGYSLVACDLTGTNAFFVREDLCSDQFQGPFTSETHFQPFRPFLRGRGMGYRGTLKSFARV